MSNPVKKSPRHAYQPPPLSDISADLEQLRAAARLFVAPGEPLRPEDAAWIADYEVILLAAGRSPDELSRDDLLELISISQRVSLRAAAVKRELLALANG
jgi:hypothetical protein